MHDLNYFRDHLDDFAEMAKRRGTVLDLDAFRKLDKERRELITATEQLKAQRNKASEEIARLKKEKQNADSLIAEMKQVSSASSTPTNASPNWTPNSATSYSLFRTFRTHPCPSARARPTRRGSPLGYAAEIRFRAQATLGSGRARRHTGSPRRHENHRRALRRFTRAGERASSAPSRFFSRCTHARARLHGNPAALPGEHRLTHRRGPIAEICCRSLKIENTTSG